MSVRTRAACVILALMGLAGPAAAEPFFLRVQPHEQPLFVQHPWRVAGNPNVTPDNPMGFVGWDGPPDDVPSVSRAAAPMAPGSLANGPFEGYGVGLS